MSSDTISALRSFLLSVLPAGVEVIRAQDNQVPQPAAADFVVMTIIGRARLATNTVTYADGGPGLAQSRKAKQPTQVTVQLDIHGPESSNTAQVISTLFRDEYGCEKFAASGFNVQPLYCGDARQVPFLNESQQVESRWTMDAVMQANPVVTTGQDFATTLRFQPVGDIREVDATAPG
jgi:hypothetical protein